MRTALSILVALTGATAIQVGYAPPATSYIYRSDNDGPASFIQLGGHGYQPQAFPAPLPLGPVKAFEAYDLAAVPLPYIAAKPIAVEDAEDDDDDSDEDGDDYGDDGLIGHGHEYAKGGGNNFHKGHHEAEGAKGSKGYNSKEYIEKGDSGHYGKEHDEGHHGEAKGEKGAYHDEAGAHGKHHESGGSYKKGDHGHKKHHSKGEEVTGYHNVFNKNEFKKDHDFYDVAEKDGHSKKYGYEKKHHQAYDSGHEKGGKGDSAYEKDNHGKAGYHSKGHVDDGEGSHSAEEGAESEYEHGKEYGEQGGKKHAKEYGYSEEDEDDE